MVSWKPCCCAKCEGCKGPTPDCLLLHATGVSGTGGSTNYLHMNGYFPLANNISGGLGEYANGCYWGCDRTQLIDLYWRVGLHIEDGNYYISATNDAYHQMTGLGEKWDPPFSLLLGTGKPSCNEIFSGGLVIPYVAGWEARHTASANLDFTGASVAVSVLKQAMPCYCKKANLLPSAGVQHICRGINVFDVGWDVHGICYAGKYPWGGVRLEIEGNDIEEIDGTYDLVGPPCALSAPSQSFTPYEIGWRIELPDPIPIPDMIHPFITHIELVVASRGTLGVQFLRKVGLTLAIVGTRVDTTPNKECLSWDGSQAFDETFDAPPLFGGGTITATALDFPPA